MLITRLFVPVYKLFHARLGRIFKFPLLRITEEYGMKRKRKAKGLDVLTICRKGTYQGYKKKTLLLAQIPLASGTTYVANTLLSLCSALLRAPTLVHGTDVRTKRIFKVHPTRPPCQAVIKPG